jgi:hypothetical protein
LDNGWNFDNSTKNEAALKPLCLEADEQFQFPARRLYRYFAATDDAILRGEPPYFGQYYRGFHIPFTGREILPYYLSNLFFHPFDPNREEPSWEEQIAFDNLIYIRDETCSDVTGCVTSYAHELQHFMQHCFTPKLLAVNQALYHKLALFKPDALTTDIPSERDAEIKSKRVAEIVCGVDAVKALAEKQIQLMEEDGAQSQKGKWLFFRDVPSSTEYNLLEATIPLVDEYKGRIDFGIDVNKAEWWLGSLDEDGKRTCDA